MPHILVTVWETEGIEGGVQEDGRRAWMAIKWVSCADRLYSRDSNRGGGEESRRATPQTAAAAAAESGDWYQRSGTATWSSQPASLQKHWTHWTHWAKMAASLHCTQWTPSAVEHTQYGTNNSQRDWVVEMESTEVKVYKRTGVCCFRVQVDSHHAMMARWI